MPVSILQGSSRRSPGGWPARRFARIGPKVAPPLDRALHRVSGGRMLCRAHPAQHRAHHDGHRSGLQRQTPLVCMPEPDGSFVVVGSNFGRDHHPAWSGNLLHNPVAEVSYQGREIPVTARLLEGTERAEVWPRLLTVWSVYDTYVERADRELRVFLLTPS